MDVVTASSNSLIVVGIASIISSWSSYKYDSRHKPVMVWLIIPTLIAMIGMRSYILPRIPEVIFKSDHLIITKQKMIMMLFAVSMAFVSRSMIKEIQPRMKPDNEPNKLQPILMVMVGLGIGLLSGILGIGGGFVLVPLLILWLGFGIVESISLSLVMIAINATLGFLAGVRYIAVDYNFLIGMILSCLLGMKLGIFWRQKMNANNLKVVFGYFILGIGIFIFAKEYFV